MIHSYAPIDSFTFVKHTLDNVTATYDIGYKLILDKSTACFSKCNYNIERFPGMHVKYKSATVIVFSSGKLNILGKTRFPKSMKYAA